MSLDGSKRQPEQLRHLAFSQSGDVPKHDDLPLTAWQCSQSGPQCNPHGVRVFVCGLSRRHCRELLAPPDLIQGDVARHPKDPRISVRQLGDTFPVGEGARKSFGGCVLSGCSITEQPVRQPKCSRKENGEGVIERLVALWCARESAACSIQ
jgi:hypothetical protein